MTFYKTVCFLGETTLREEEISLTVYSQICSFLDCGACGFIFSADSSFGLLCAEQVILRKKRQKGNFPDFVRLFAFIPYEEHIEEKTEAFRTHYYDVLEHCDVNVVFEKDKTEFVESDFIQEIIDCSDIIICAEKCEYARLYATAKGKKIIDI